MSADLALELEDVVFRYQEKGKRNILDHTSLSRTISIFVWFYEND